MIRFVRRYELGRLRAEWLGAARRRFRSAPGTLERGEATVLADHYGGEYVRLLDDANAPATRNELSEAKRSPDQDDA